MRKKEGFTLIELLVTISILSVLSAIAIVVFSSVTARVRDSQRIKDLQSIKQALELYRSDVHNYPATSLGLITALAPYLSSIPQDTDPARRPYKYLALPSSPACDNTSLATACSSFVLCAKKENASTADFPDCKNLNSSCGLAGNCDIGISSQ